MNQQSRREFITRLSAATGALVLAPVLTRCGAPNASTLEAGEIAVSLPTTTPVPLTRPSGWDPIRFNKDRGNAGAIPDTYLDDINGPDGDMNHLGKHLPYIPDIDSSLLPDGYIALMWGDPEKGHARHPNASEDPATGYIGHWYNWIRVRRAVDGDSEEIQSNFTAWPAPSAEDTGIYLALDGGDITADSGKNTIYLVGLPDGAASGDEIRVYAHCLHHGEYVDFLTT